jgi:anti-sigma factor ChrR (cupin superfamily)
MASRFTDHDLIAYAAGDLSGAEAAAVEEHLAGHPQAQATVQRYRAAREAIRRDDSVAPPADVVNRAKAIFRERREARIGWIDRLDALVATLVFDSRLQPAAVRYRPGDGEFQLAFEAGEADIDLQGVRQGNDRWTVRGQVTCDHRGSFPVVLCMAGAEGPVEQLETDHRGLFETLIDAGSYDLILELPDRAVLLRNIQIQ